MTVKPRYCVIWEFQPTFSPKPKGRSIIREIYILFREIWDPKIVQERLGHTDISMTLNRYSHVTPTMQKSAAQLLGNALDI